MPKTGGAPTTLALEPGFIPFDIAVGGGFVYWVRGTDWAVMRVPTDGCEEPEVVHQAPGFRGVHRRQSRRRVLRGDDDASVC